MSKRVSWEAITDTAIRAKYQEGDLVTIHLTERSGSSVAFVNRSTRYGRESWVV